MIKKLFGFLAVAVLACCSVSALAQGSIPLAEHEMLQMDDGVWHASISMWGADGSETARGTAKETNTIVGGIWSIGRMEGEIAGTDFVGYATLGYDPMQEQYVGTWIDSATPVMAHMVGEYEAETKTLILFYTIYLDDGHPQERKNVMVYEDEKTRDFVAFRKSGDEWIKVMEILYERID